MEILNDDDNNNKTNKNWGYEILPLKCIIFPQLNRSKLSILENIWHEKAKCILDRFGIQIIGLEWNCCSHWNACFWKMKLFRMCTETNSNGLTVQLSNGWKCPIYNSFKEEEKNIFVKCIYACKPSQWINHIQSLSSESFLFN